MVPSLVDSKVATVSGTYILKPIIVVAVRDRLYGVPHCPMGSWLMTQIQ